MKNYLSPTIKGIVTLVLISVFGLSSSAQLNFSAGQDITICEGQSANIISTVTNVPNGETVAYSWTSNPGNYQSNIANPTISNLPVGTYVFTGTATAGVSSVSDQVVVNVSSNPYVTVGVSNSIGLCTGQTVDFLLNPNNPFTNAPNSPGTTYTFVVSDNPSSPTVFTDIQGTQNISHTFTTSSCGQPGGAFPANTFYATVIASNACGTTSSVVSPITVSAVPSANFNVSATTICLNSTLTLTNTGTSGNVITGPNNNAPFTCTNTGGFYYTISPSTGWSSGGTIGAAGVPAANWANITSASNTASVNFTTPGTYTISQKYQNGCGVSTFERTICVVAPPVCSFTPSSLSGCASLPVTVIIGTTGPSCGNPAVPLGLSYNWSVTDPAGGNSVLASVSSAITSIYLFNGATTALTFPISVVVNPLMPGVTPATPVANCSSTCTQNVILYPEPTFTTQPQTPGSVCLGGTFNAITAVVNYLGTGIPVYQWYSNTLASNDGGTLISGATSSSYTPLATAVGTIYYYCVATFPASTGCNQIISNSVPAIVAPGPTLTTQPTSSNVSVGGATNPMCVAYTNGSGTATYQWYGNALNNTTTGTAIPGATTNCFTPPSTTAGANYYYSIVSLSGGGCSSITSNTAAVTITANDSISTQLIPSQTICIGGTIPTPLSVSYTGGNGTPIYQWYSWPNTVIAGATSSSYTPPVFTASGTYSYYVVVNAGSSSQTSNTASIIVLPDPTVTISSSSSYCQNSGNVSPITVVVTGGVGTPSFQWYANTINSNTGGTLITGATTSTYSPPTATVGTFYYYCVVTTTASGCSVTSATATVNINPGPTFTTQPTSSSVPVGGTTNQMCVTYINGTGPASYQWFGNAANNTTTGTAIPGATSNCYTPPSTTAGANYYYSIVSLSGGGCSSITSNTAAVTITANDSISTQLIPSQTICIGGTIPTPLSVSYTGGNGTPTYQWYLSPSNTAIAGATSSSYTPPVFAASGTYSYYVVVNAGSSSQTSNTASIIVVPDPTVTISSSSSYCQNSGNVSPITVVVTGGVGMPSYQWYSNTINSNTGGTIISGANSISYSPLVATTGTTYYYCMITQSGTNCAVNSPTAQIIVTPAPTFTTQPAATQSVCVGGATTSFTVAYSNGTGAATYQWYSNATNTYTNGVLIITATTANYTPPSASAGTTYYYCVVSFSAGGGCSLINSNIAQVIVDPSLCGGITAQAEFSMAAQGCNPVAVTPVNTSILNPICGDVTYQWNIAPSFAQFVSGTNSSSLNPVIQFTLPGNYTVSLTLNSCGTITTVSHQILVETAPAVSIASASSCSPYSYMPGVNVAQADIISNTPVNSFSWSVNPNVQVTNSNSANPTIQFNQSGIYTIGLQVSNICGTDTDQAQIEIFGDAISYYQDTDNDSFGNSNIEIISCVQPAGYVANNLDCNDANASINPSALEVVGNGIDENCDGENTIFSYGILDSTPIVSCNDESVVIAVSTEPFGLPNYGLQWYFKTGNIASPAGSSTIGWNMISGATSTTLGVAPFIGTRTYACFVTPDASYGISGEWMVGAKVLTYNSFTAQTIIGNPNITPFNSYNYIVNPISGHTYSWSVTNGAIASGQGTNNVSIMWGQNGPYQVTLNESDGTCSGSSVLFAVNNNCNLTVIAASATTTSFCSGASVQLQAATTATNITYQWYLNGVAIAGETNQNTAATLGGNYQVSITQNGCSAISQILAITELPGITMPTLVVDQANAGCSGSDATVSLTDANYSAITWSNGTVNTSSINVSESGSYTVTVTDNNGCTATSSAVEVNLSLVDVVPICLVTVDQTTGKNNVVWEPVTSDMINLYVVLKETNVANVYAQIGTVAYGSNGLFEDVNANPQVQANRYKLALIDTCGILSSNSDFHKTIHLATNQGLGNNVNLIWSGYEGFDFGSYNIYRGASAGTMTLLTTIASNLDSYTDINPPVGEVYYMIEVEGVSCDPQRTLVYSHSNVITTTTDGVEELSNAISLYPNPATTSINLQVNTSLIGQEYIVFDAIGKVIYKSKIQSTNEIIQLENFNNGNYFVKVNEVVKRFEVMK